MSISRARGLIENILIYKDTKNLRAGKVAKCLSIMRPRMVGKKVQLRSSLPSALIQSNWSALRPVRFVPEERAQGIYWMRNLVGSSWWGVRQEKTNLCSASNRSPVLPGRPACRLVMDCKIIRWDEVQKTGWDCRSIRINASTSGFCFKLDTPCISTCPSNDINQHCVVFTTYNSNLFMYNTHSYQHRTFRYAHTSA